MANVWQQVLALDAKFNAYRTPNSPGFKTLYIRRRSQLLRENLKKPLDPQFRKWYIKVRGQLLSRRYGVAPSEGSTRSSLSKSGALSTSQLTLDVEFSDLNLRCSVPNSEADSCRVPVVGSNTCIGENYSFTGVHHIFDQHLQSNGGGGITRLKFAFDERSRLAVSSADSTLSICTISDDANQSRMTLKLKGHTDAVTDFCWSVSNDLIVSCSLDCTVRVWDSNSGECIRIVQDQCGVLCCVFQPLNNNLVVTGNSKGAIQMLNISTGKYIKAGSGKCPGSAICMCCDNAGHILWVGDDKGHIISFLVDTTTGKISSGKKIMVSLNRPVTSICCRAWISKECRDTLLLANTCANSLGLFKAVGNDGNLVNVRRIPVRQNAQKIHSCFCPLMSFRQGAVIVSGSEDGNVYLFDIERETRHYVNQLQGHESAVIDVAFNHDESFLASGDEKGTVIVWKREKTSPKY